MSKSFSLFPGFLNSGSMSRDNIVRGPPLNKGVRLWKESWKKKPMGYGGWWGDDVGDE